MSNTISDLVDNVFPLSGSFVLGMAFVVVLVFLRRLQVSGKKEFNKMFEATKPSLEPGPSAYARVTTGTLGCLQAAIAIFLIIVFAVLAFDAFFNDAAGLIGLLTSGL